MTTSEELHRDSSIVGTRASVEAFLCTEARLLDENRLVEWLALFTEDALYWLPCGDEENPLENVAIIYDDRSRIEERVHRIESGLAHAQEPRSKTVRMLGSIEVEERPHELIASSNFMIVELRRGEQRLFAGRYTHWLRPFEGSWRIAIKKVDLLTKNEPIGNLSFIV